VFSPPLCRSERAELDRGSVSTHSLSGEGTPQGARVPGEAGRPRADSRASESQDEKRRPPAPSAQLCCVRSGGTRSGG